MNTQLTRSSEELTQSVDRSDACGAPMREWFLGVPFTPAALPRAAQLIAGRPAQAPFAFIVTPNAQHAVATWRGHARYDEAVRRAWLVLNDSSALRVLARCLFGRDLPQATGSDLTALLFERHITPDDAVTIIGGDAEMVDRLKTQFGLSRIAQHAPPMGLAQRPDDIARCVDFMAAHPARYTFIVAGFPQSEWVAMAALERGGLTGVALPVGSALNFLTGAVKRAPPWIRRANLEWLYRLAINPVGHARRVFVESFPIVLIAVAVRARPGRGDRHEWRRGGGGESGRDLGV